MNLLFFIKSATVDISNYTIKEIPGSTGRLDVISRCILAALGKNDELKRNVQIWVFLDKYGTFIFDSKLINHKIFPKTELRLTDYFVEIIRNKNSIQDLQDNPLKSISYSEVDIFNVMKELSKNDYNTYILSEEGEDFIKKIKDIQSQSNILFLIGDQTGDFLNSEKLLALELNKVSLGNQSYLASSVIRLILLLIDLNQ